MSLQPITYNNTRYTQNAAGNWTISATSSVFVPPINLINNRNEDIVVSAQLHSDGMLIHVGDSYLISQQTLNDISASSNPHYDFLNNGSVTIKNKTTQVGQTIPIIKVDIEKLGDIASKRNQIGVFAGVANVEYSYQTPMVDGVPKGIIDQLNYTLVQEDERPSDKFSIWDLGLEADYSVEALKIETAQGDKILDKTKLKKFLAGISDRLALLRKDFNMIKSIYYNGLQPTTNARTMDYNKQAQTEDQDELEDKQSKQVIFKQSQITSVESTPVSQAATTPDTNTSASVQTGTPTTTTGPKGSNISTPPVNPRLGGVNAKGNYNSAPMNKK
jgi:hypothetical protein